MSPVLAEQRAAHCLNLSNNGCAQCEHMARLLDLKCRSHVRTCWDIASRRRWKNPVCKKIVRDPEKSGRNKSGWKQKLIMKGFYSWASIKIRGRRIHLCNGVKTKKYIFVFSSQSGLLGPGFSVRHVRIHLSYSKVSLKTWRNKILKTVLHGECT